MFEYMDYIYEVYRTASFSQAAKNLFISQPALSISIKKAEEKLGFQIFNRQTNPISLTEEGSIYIESILKIHEIEDGLNDRLLELNNLQYGFLNIGGTNFFASYMLPLVIRPFSQQYPRINLQITEADSISLYTQGTHTEVDLIFDAGDCDPEQFEMIPLFYEQLLLGVPKNFAINKSLKQYQLTADEILLKKHLEDKVPYVPLSKFQGQKLLLLNKHHDLHTRSMEICYNEGLNPTDVLYLNQLMTAYNFSLHEIGITFLTDTVVSLSNRRDNLLYYRVRGPQARRLCFFAYRKFHIKTKAMEKFIEFSRGILCKD